MLLELRVENYAVIDNVAVEFASGLNLLTGETGAGKSILIDALALLLGEKASSEVVRHGTEKAVVSCVFDTASAGVARILEENGMDGCSDDAGLLILRREIHAGGKGRVFVNNRLATVAVLRQLAQHLAAVHAQNESILAFDAAARMELLDAFAGADIGPVAQAFAQWHGLRERISELKSGEQDCLRLADLWAFQRKEIEQARLEPGEDERLETEKRVLADAEKVYVSAMAAYDALYDGAASASACLRTASRHLEELARYDTKFEAGVSEIESARLVVEDLSATVRDYAGAINGSPDRLAAIEDRLALLDRLKRKYGRAIEDVIVHGAQAARKLDELENRDELLHKLNQELASAGEEYLAAARTLSRKRHQAARRLEKLVEGQIQDLAMKGSFKIELSGGEDEGNWSARGFDQVTYLIATNPGEPLRPVEQIASGGEMARVMLALRVSIETPGAPTSNGSKQRVQRTLVFDEIDTGIGGRAAEAVGRKLKALARGNQVICITHLPQIASFADHHYVIEKREAGGRSHTSIHRLSQSARTEEIARMLSGARLTDTSRKHAEHMLKANA